MNQKPVGIVIVNYNMPERADALAEYIYKYVDYPFHLALVDNGSDICKPALNTNHWLKENIQTTRGWLSGLEYLNGLYGYDFLAYWFLITSAEFVENVDILSPMAWYLNDNAPAVGIHPALTEDSTTSWSHMKRRGGAMPRQTWFIDNIASLWRAEWFDYIGRFDPALVYGWGIDLETCYHARTQRKTLWIDERVWIKKVTDIGYKMGRMNMSAEERRTLAGSNMTDVLFKKYGGDWHYKMYDFLVYDWMR